MAIKTIPYSTAASTASAKDGVYGQTTSAMVEVGGDG